jgi:hypothetical protein
MPVLADASSLMVDVVQFLGRSTSIDVNCGRATTDALRAVWPCAEKQPILFLTDAIRTTGLQRVDPV